MDSRTWFKGLIATVDKMLQIYLGAAQKGQLKKLFARQLQIGGCCVCALVLDRVGCSCA
jgi:hypothetical protein